MMNPSERPQEPAWQALHDEAKALGKQFYIDPATGFMVWTALHHQKRGYCCQSNCRHCPFGFDPLTQSCSAKA